MVDKHEAMFQAVAAHLETVIQSVSYHRTGVTRHDCDVYGIGVCLAFAEYLYPEPEEDEEDMSGYDCMFQRVAGQEDVEDARRYRWLKQWARGSSLMMDGMAYWRIDYRALMYTRARSFDEAVDAAMRAEEEQAS